MIERVVSEWMAYVRGELPGGLERLLDDDVVFYSPIVFTPQRGKQVTSMYLAAAARTFVGEHRAAGSDGSFRYTKTVLAGDTAVLEFETTLEGKYVNGVDIIRCTDQGRIIEFRVMIRPLQAVNLVHQQISAMLESMEK
jgi:ketosteroid isomerase-like protein